MLSEVYYGDMALRQSGDIDLFVRKRDVARIKSTRFAIWDIRRGCSSPKMLRKITLLRDMSGLSTVLLDRTFWNCSGRCSRGFTRSTSTWTDCLSGR